MTEPMTPHERGVDQAARVFRGETLTASRIVRDYGVSRATAKRDMSVLRQAFEQPPARHGRRSSVAAWERAA